MRIAAALMLALLPLCGADELETAYNNLKAAEAKKDAADVVKWAAETSRLAREAAAKPEPASEAEKSSWKSRVDWAKQVDTYSEYALYALALQPVGAGNIALLVEALEKQNPRSQYLNQLAAPYLMALNQSNRAADIVPAAQRRLEHDPENEDLLLVLADGYLSSKQPDKALAMAQKLTAVMEAKARPEAVPADVWEKKKAGALGRGYWIAGIVYADQKKHAEADKVLRAALPYLANDAAMMGPAAFYLGIANYEMGKASKNRAKLADALKFSEQSGAIAGPYQAAAQKNAKSIRAELPPASKAR
ncbi:MAG: hypothetical protein K2X35_19655 [Bryobacteraceae bacterium]|nr:hypothetical protein [Bryobacteraceae bacterium]